MLKLIQSLEAAVAGASQGTLQMLKARIEAAEQGGCPEAVLAGPKQLLLHLQIAEAHELLDAALKLRSVQGSTQRTAALQVLLGGCLNCLQAEHHLKYQQNTGGVGKSKHLVGS